MEAMKILKAVDAKLASKVIGCAIEFHRNLVAGLLESAYESCLSRELDFQGIPFSPQVPIEILEKREQINCAYRMDLVVNYTLLLELKSIESLQPIHQAQTISYLKLSGLKQGQLINFNICILKDRIRSFLN